jgi:hypothetical protein
MPSETETFQNDLLESVKQMKSGKPARVTQIQVPHRDGVITGMGSGLAITHFRTGMGSGLAITHFREPV